jgi:hypothetical protein
MARKDAPDAGGADGAGIALSMRPPSRRMDRSIADGHGQADWTVVTKDFVARPAAGA